MKPSKVFHNVLVLPVKGRNKDIYVIEVCICIHVDIEKGICFMSTITQV